MKRRDINFLFGFGVVVLVLAAGLSYLADSDPDGLDSVLQQGCSVTETGQGEQLSGRCIAQNEQDHPLADSPLADYTVGGDDRWKGVAGALGVAATVVVAGGFFWLLRRRGADSGAGTGVESGEARARDGS
jgi:cobalt/nickel transport protein